MADDTRLIPLPPFKSWLASNIPAVYDNTMTYYEELCAMISYLEKQVTPVVNANTLGLETLKTYVEDYFKNLDVEQEVDAKLDQMAEDGTLQELVASYLNANVAWTFNTVAEMTEATNLQNGSFARTLGFRNVNDGGGALYRIDQTGTANGMDVIAIGSLKAHLILPSVMTPELVGAYGDGTHDDYAFIVRALELSDKVCLYNKTYLLEYRLTIPENKELSGLKDSLGYAKINALLGIKLAGRKITIKNIELTGANQENYGLYCCGNNEGGSTEGANHFSQCIVKNMIINNYNYAIYFAGVIWDNTFDNIRTNQNNYGIYSGSTFYVMTTTFNNVYFSGSKVYNVQMAKTNAQFNCCNFGISTYKCLQFTQQCNVKIENSNFECDKAITGTGVLIEVTGKNLTISNCSFKMCCANTITLFSTGAAVQNLSLNSNTYESVTISGTANELVKIFGDSITGAKFGCINVNKGNNDLPINIQITGRLPYGKYPYVRLNGYIQAYSNSDVTLANLTIGDLVYFYQTNTIAYYNGSALKTITAS